MASRWLDPALALALIGVSLLQLVTSPDLTNSLRAPIAVVIIGGAVAFRRTHPVAAAAVQAAVFLATPNFDDNFLPDVGAVAPSEELSLEVWSQTLAVNLTGTFLCAQAAARHMLPAGRGVIVNVGSVFAATGMPMRAAYAASKHGVVGLTKVLGTEWATRGIRVVAVDPAYVRTALDDADQRAGGYTAEDIERRTPMGRYAEPAEIARVVAFLASDDASFITGSEVAVDGGWLAYGDW